MNIRVQKYKNLYRNSHHRRELLEVTQKMGDKAILDAVTVVKSQNPPHDKKTQQWSLNGGAFFMTR